ncbi:hypothetical protein WJX73_007740 [Symbiochloris irregularis]|uniref:F-box domain-containing protein n=1 Tax=Symbiochloris irregularis TaxID=706552 RepID=A0AAW1PXA5_9CHLO
MVSTRAQRAHNVASSVPPEQATIATAQAPWATAPEDIVIAIFKKLQFSDRCLMEAACKTWRRLLTSPQRPGLWGELQMKLSLDRLDPDVLVAQLPEAGHDWQGNVVEWLSRAFAWVASHTATAASVVVTYESITHGEHAVARCSGLKHCVTSKMLQLLVDTFNNRTQRPDLQGSDKMRLCLNLPLHGDEDSLKKLHSSKMDLKQLISALHLVAIGGAPNHFLLTGSLKGMSALQSLTLNSQAGFKGPLTVLPW